MSQGGLVLDVRLFGHCVWSTGLSLVRYFSFRWDLETHTRIFLYRNLKSHNVTKSRLKILYTNTLLLNYFISATKKKNHIPKVLLGLYNEIEEKHLQLLSVYTL